MGVTQETDIASAGEGADGLVRIELDSAGQLWDVVLHPDVTQLTVDELRTALFDAITQAQAGLPGLDETIADATSVADRRFAEISEALHAISRRRR
ncbi:hypothetical protein [Actinoplanes sp. G11-F43]|uniref:hypothetical protein n=1 Tax=Actinoplanes sp. G11-F43 TaxID=3424130 RepID=UPI003D34FDC5